MKHDVLCIQRQNRMVVFANQENSTLGLEAVEAEENAEKELLDNAGKKRKGGARDEIQTTVPAHKNEEIFVLFYVLFVLCRSVYCLCVNVYCTTATG